MNVLLITLDQFRADALGCHPGSRARTPHLDRLAAEGVRFARHYSQAAPCGPGRASLYTGLYQMNHRVVANGTPLDARFDNIAKAARRAGYAPTLFGYTDQAFDPRAANGPADPRLRSYEEVLPGFEVGVHLPSEAPVAWLDWLKARGREVDGGAAVAYATEPLRPASESCAAFLTEAVIEWASRQRGPWFAHLSHLRPHPPYAAAGDFAAMFDPQDMPPRRPARDGLHRLYDRLRSHPQMAAPDAPGAMGQIWAQYLGMVAEVDAQFGRLRQALEQAGQWAETVVVVTSDHGEHLGDHGLLGKGGFFEESYHIPLIIRDPRPGAARGAAVEASTEAVDIFPTLCELMDIDPPSQCDGFPLTPFLMGRPPAAWRDGACWEFDWRGALIQEGEPPRPFDRRLERQNLAVRRTKSTAYVHFGDGSHLAFDLAADPGWGAALTDPADQFEAAQGLLTWRAQHLNRTLTGLIVRDGPVGLWPVMPQDWRERAAPAGAAGADDAATSC